MKVEPWARQRMAALERVLSAHGAGTVLTVTSTGRVQLKVIGAGRRARSSALVWCERHRTSEPVFVLDHVEELPIDDLDYAARVILGWLYMPPPHDFDDAYLHELILAAHGPLDLDRLLDPATRPDLEP